MCVCGGGGGLEGLMCVCVCGGGGLGEGLVLVGRGELVLGG